MSKQDVNAVRTAQDLEIKYDLSSLAGLKKNYEIQKQGLTKVENELNDFVNATTKDIEEIKNQVDGNITTWFSSGIPTVENYPANEWSTDNDKNNHLGDLYYDNDTGKGYRFTKQDDDYLWYEITDTDTTEALALASKAQDTADSKRRVFLITPYVPYDKGDLWLNNEELYVCNKSKTIEETYDANDFEKATKYTDDSALNNFISGEYADDLELINTQIDKKAETWYQSSDPSVVWTTDEIKKYHIGDLWYNTVENKNYIYTSNYIWDEIDGVPDSVYDEIDGKAQIFTSQPTPPYYKGDLFTQGNTGDILVCITERLTGSYNTSDWKKAGKYTDDTNLNNFVNVTYAEAMKNLTNQIDSKITTWYYSGEPTLDNEPANSWDDEDKLKHTGDLYYDQDTGYVYRFSLDDDIYSWEKITDKDVVESLALANSAKDTADRKRQVFVAEPIPPYDVGDLWIRDEEIYRCQTSRPDGEIFEDNDWIKATKYTDDTVANQVDGKLTILSGTVTEIKQNVDELKTTMTNTTKVVDEQGNTIGILQEKQSETTQTVNGITTKVSSVENSLSTTNSNLSNLSDKVNTLSDDIDGVSADFEDFKDNEYIQSIDNLQKQIDGAIQFWNGAEIPTVSNYPANEWTTENDKINHQADIYTVVKDVEGEMKQGKSYRFDKVNGVWQWIELTDNELSAVQALAQEALNKANTNANEIGTVKTRVSLLEQTDEQIKASVESIDKQIIPTASVSGSNIYIEDASTNPLVQLEIEGKSEQATRSGKNELGLIDGTYTNDEVTAIVQDGVVTVNGTPSTTGWLNISTEQYSLISGNTYTLSLNNLEALAGGVQLRTLSSGALDCSFATVNRTNTQTLTEDASNTRIQIRFVAGITFNNFVFKPQIEIGSATEFEPYGVSPSPDYPSEIESVGHKNIFDEEFRQGSNTSSTTSYYIFSKNTINCKKNKNYIFSTNLDTNIYKYAIQTNVQEFPTSNANSDNTGWTNTSTVQLKTTIDGYLGIMITKNNGASITIDEIKNVNFQLEEGLTAHPYIPFTNGKYGIEVKTVGKQLFNKNNITSGKILVRSTGSTSTNANYGVSDYISVKKGITYYQQGTNIYYSVYYDKYYNYVTYIDNTSRAFTPSQDGYIRTSFLLTDIDKVQVEKGDTPTKVEEYKSNTSVILLNEPLRSLPNGVKDIAYIRNNKLYVERYIGSIVLDGSESYSTRSSAVSGIYGVECNIVLDTIAPINNDTLPNILCDYFLQETENQRYTNNIGVSLTSNNKLRFYDGVSISADEFKTWLSTHNIQVDYELATPITEEYGEIDMPSTFKGVNNIYVNDDLEPTLNIEYVRDTTLSNYVEGQINKVMTIEERHYSELVIEDNSIKASVTEINSNISDMTEDIHTVQETLTSTEKTIEIISTNIDKTTGEIREVTTINGYKFNKDGLNIYTNENSFNTLIDNKGTYYKDGNTIIAETTKDGFMATNIKNKGSQEYCYDESNKVYEFVKERVEVDGEYGYATFYNGVN